ncbi:hypothetical protein GCM10023205_84320 [Yinghuangia aomiensis]|uniref:Transposase n=1 Tax=Yinghuangia aomiensis TaxID=676205 RepID=A0ABP9IH12_9ACTN
MGRVLLGTAAVADTEGLLKRPAECRAPWRTGRGSDRFKALMWHVGAPRRRCAPTGQVRGPVVRADPRSGRGGVRKRYA